jgi:hypothetical protein
MEVNAKKMDIKNGEFSLIKYKGLLISNIKIRIK